MTQQDTTSFSELLEKVERLLPTTLLHPEDQRRCIQILNMALQTTTNRPVPVCDFQAIRGNNHVKRALEVASAGGHNILLSGPPLAGKAQFARTLPGLLPDFSPFRAPEAAISQAALLGDLTSPGELTLAHTGVLFLKGLHTFDPSLLSVIRQVVENRKVTILKAEAYVHAPANFLLIATALPCPCGFLDDPIRKCLCSTETVLEY